MTERSIQHDVESLRLFLAEQMAAQDIVFDRKHKGYRMTNSEILAVYKILLESRSMMQERDVPHSG